MFYGASTMICTPASLAQEVGLALGAQAGEARLAEVVTEGGFSRFRRATETPFNLDPRGAAVEAQRQSLSDGLWTEYSPLTSRPEGVYTAQGGTERQARPPIRDGLVIGVLLLALTLSAPAFAHSGDQLSEYGSAAVDGVISPKEYGDSCIGPVTQPAPPGGVQASYTFTICETNDTENDYYAVQIDDQTNGPVTPHDDSLSFFFDNAHDGAIVPGADRSCAPVGEPVEDFIAFFQVGDGSPGFTDLLYCKLTSGGFFAADPRRRSRLPERHRRPHVHRREGMGLRALASPRLRRSRRLRPARSTTRSAGA